MERTGLSSLVPRVTAFFWLYRGEGGTETVSAVGCIDMGVIYTPHLLREKILGLLEGTPVASRQTKRGPRFSRSPLTKGVAMRATRASLQETPWSLLKRVLGGCLP